MLVGPSICLPDRMSVSVCVSVCPSACLTCMCGADRRVKVVRVVRDVAMALAWRICVPFVYLLQIILGVYMYVCMYVRMYEGR